jgi:PmbA protein
MSHKELREAAERIVSEAMSLGAEEARVTVGEGSYSQLERRDGKVEKAQESRSRSAGLSLMVDGRFSAHSTNDLRPTALTAFLERAVAASRYLEPDPDRCLPDLDLMGVAVDNLDAVDPGFSAYTAENRRESCEELEQLCRARASEDPVRSITAYAWEGRSDSALVTSNGFSSSWSGTSFGHGATVSLEDADGRLPEAWSTFSTRHLADLPSAERVADDLIARGRQRLGSAAAESGRYALLLDRRVVGRMLGTLLGPLSGTSIYEQRSCMAGKLGEKIAAGGLSIYDNPLIPRAPGSRPHDGDGLPSKQRAILEDGVLKMYFLGVYNSRRLKMAPTTSGASNLIVPPGPRSVADIQAGLGRAIRVEGFLGGNSNPTSGDFSYGVLGTLVEDGKDVRPVSEMNVSGNVFTLLDSFVEAANDPWVYSSWRVPTLLFDDIQFSGT